MSFLRGGQTWVRVTLFHLVIRLSRHFLRSGPTLPQLGTPPRGHTPWPSEAGPSRGSPKDAGVRVGGQGRPRTRAGRMGTWAAGCSCGLVLPPLVSKIICHLQAGLVVSGPPRESGQWQVFSPPPSREVGQHWLLARGASPQTLSPPPRGNDVTPPPRLPSHCAHLVAVSTQALMSRLCPVTQNKSSQKHKDKKMQKKKKRRKKKHQKDYLFNFFKTFCLLFFSFLPKSYWRKCETGC